MTAFIASAGLMMAAGLGWLLHPLWAGVRPTWGGSADRRVQAGTTLALLLLVPVAAVLLYARLGRFDALSVPPPEAGTVNVRQMVDRLAARVANQPDDLAAWRLLARSYDALQRLPEAVQAHAKLVELQPGNADALADLADALATLQGGHFGGEPVRHAREALRLDPNQAKALAIAANEASERNDPAAAIAFWERLAALVPPGSAVAKSLAANIAAAREAAAGRD